MQMQLLLWHQEPEMFFLPYPSGIWSILEKYIIDRDLGIIGCFSPKVLAAFLFLHCRIFPTRDASSGKGPIYHVIDSFYRHKKSRFP